LTYNDERLIADDLHERWFRFYIGSRLCKVRLAQKENALMSSPKRCLLVITGAFALDGGIAAANRLVIEALTQTKCSIEIIAFNEGVNSAMAYRHLPNLQYQAAQLSKLRFALMVWRQLVSRRYDIIFCDHVNLASIVAPAAMLGIARYVVRLNGIEVFPAWLDTQGRLGLRFAWRRLAISEYTRQQVLQSFPRLDVQTVELGLDQERTKRLQDVTEQLMSSSELLLTAVDGVSRVLGDSVVLHVGRMAAAEQYKGQDLLIKAMPYILAQHEAAQLVLVGKGDDMSRLLLLAQSLSPEVQSRIFMPGFVSNELLEQLYQACALFAMPSQGEGFGFVYIEAMCWKKPCIASRVDAAQFIVRHEETGLLIDEVKNPVSVADAVLELLQHPDRAARYGQRAYEAVKTKYVFEQFCTRFLAAIGLSEL